MSFLFGVLYPKWRSWCWRTAGEAKVCLHAIWLTSWATQLQSHGVFGSCWLNFCDWWPPNNLKGLEIHWLNPLEYWGWAWMSEFVVSLSQTQPIKESEEISKLWVNFTAAELDFGSAKMVGRRPMSQRLCWPIVPYHWALPWFVEGFEHILQCHFVGVSFEHLRMMLNWLLILTGLVETINQELIWYDMIWYDMIWYDILYRYNLIYIIILWYMYNIYI